MLAAGVVYLFAAAGCKKGYLDINQNPNNPADVAPELVLPAALNSTAARQVNAFNFVSGWMGQWAVSGSYAPSTSNFTTYKETTDFGGGLWATIYNTLEDYQYVETKSAELAAGLPDKAAYYGFYQGAAKIMKSHDFQQLVDMFGDVPYFNALQGTTNLQPVYDDAQAIYQDLIVQINAGIDLMQAAISADVSLPTGSDIMFKGDFDSWIRFANSLKLRILIRQSEVNEAYAKEEAGKIQGGFLDQDAAVNPGYINSAGKQNPFWSANYNTGGTYINDFWRANQFGLDMYEDYDDPRAHLVYGPTPGNSNVWQGNYIGATDGYVGSASSIFGPGVLKSVGQPAVIMLEAESDFLQAEAALRGWLGGDAEDLYHDGIIASFEYYGVPDAATAATAYYSDPSNDLAYWKSGQTQTFYLNLIIAQKWLAENTVTPLEVWDDYRRLPNLPFNQSIPLTESPYYDVLAVPVRILYVTSEYATNAANVPSQDAQAHHTQKIFWMP